MTRTRPNPGRGRGRPLVFTDTQKTAYLAHVRAGWNLNQAAARTGVNRRTVNLHAQQDPAFHQARELAKKEGREIVRAARWKDMPHDEFRYNHGKCRCTTCCTAARKGRASRRAAAAPKAGPEPGEAPTVISLPNRDMRPDQHLHPLAAVS